MNELSLFSGAGGGLLATKHLLGWTTIGYVENELYCQKVLKQRISDGFLDAAPIFGDIRAFISEGYAEEYQGVVDVITAGFPCQPFSVAGKQQGEDDPRNMWPETAKVISIVEPKFVLLENVPGIRRYVPVVIRDLRRNGYVVRRPLVVSAQDIGAKQLRKRVWVVAHLNTERLSQFKPSQTKREGWARPHRFLVSYDWGTRNPSKAFIRRGVHGSPNRVDRIKALGEIQIPAVVELAWKVLTET